MGMVKHLQRFQDGKFAMSVQYFKKEVRDEIHFLHPDNHQSFLQVDFNCLGIKVSLQADTSIIDGHDQAFSISFLQYLYNILRKKELIFCMQINIKVSTTWRYRF